MSVKINKDLCIGCGMCVAACGECFVFEDDGKAGVIKGVDNTNGCASEAAANCPVQAIEID